MIFLILFVIIRENIELIRELGKDDLVKMPERASILCVGKWSKLRVCTEVRPSGLPN